MQEDLDWALLPQRPFRPIGWVLGVVAAETTNHDGTTIQYFVVESTIRPSPTALRYVQRIVIDVDRLPDQVCDLGPCQESIQTKGERERDRGML